MRVVIALGGNALLRRGEPMDVALQRDNLKRAAVAIAEIAQEHEVIVTHGNGPQVGLLALQNEAYTGAPPAPLDVLDAETEGMVGYPDAVYQDWGTPAAHPIRITSAPALRSLEAPAGSMGPKIDAVCQFIEWGGSLAAIGTLEDAPALLRGQAGTVLHGTAP